MIKGKTKSGFEYQIAKNTLDNYELLELIGEIDTSPTAFTQVINQLLGPEQKDALKEHVRSEDGVVSTKALVKEFQDIFTGHQEIKK